VKKAAYLFLKWANVERVLKGKAIYLFLDYDGTLVPIAQTPQMAIMPEKTKELLRRLSKKQDIKIAIVSGRSLADISSRVGLENVVYVGNHGYEIKGPKIDFESPVSSGHIKMFEEIRDNLQKSLSSIKGVIVEDKKYSLSLHYRLVDEQDIPKVREEVYTAIASNEAKDDICVIEGKKVLEIRPAELWDKGKAVLWLLGRQRFAMRDKKTKIVPVYIGDDSTDEDAFGCLKEKGITIFTGNPGDTKAQLYLKDTGEVLRFLENILNI
jgi:trehalose-phosphatase